MTGQPPHEDPWQQEPGLLAAVAARARARARMRVITLTAGAAGLVTAGVVALNLPGSTHGTSASAGNASPAAVPGDDREAGNDGAQRASSGQSTPAPRPASGGSHATSGGS